MRTECICFLSCCNKWPHTGWLKTAGMYYLNVLRLEVCSQAPKGLGKMPSCRCWWLPTIRVVLWLLDASVSIVTCRFLCESFLFFLCSKLTSSFKDTHHIGLRTYSSTGWFHLNLTTSGKILFPSKVTFTGPWAGDGGGVGLGLKYVLLGDPLQPSNIA